MTDNIYRCNKNNSIGFFLYLKFYLHDIPNYTFCFRGMIIAHNFLQRIKVIADSFIK